MPLLASKKLKDSFHGTTYGKYERCKLSNLLIALQQMMELYTRHGSDPALMEYDGTLTDRQMRTIAEAK